MKSLPNAKSPPSPFTLRASENPDKHWGFGSVKREGNFYTFF